MTLIRHSPFKLNKPLNNWGFGRRTKEICSVIYLDVDYNNYESEYTTDLVTNRLRQRFRRLKTPLKIIILLAIEICLVISYCTYRWWKIVNLIFLLLYLLSSFKVYFFVKKKKMLRYHRKTLQIALLF